MLVRPIRADEHATAGELTVAAYTAIEPATTATDYADELRDVTARSVGVEILVAVDDLAAADGAPAGSGPDRPGGAAILGAVTYVPGPDSPAAEFTDEDAAGIRMLAVALDAQGRGVGEALTRACVARARAAGRGQVVLHSTDRMTTAHRLYLRLGFHRDESIDWEPEPGLWLRGFRLRLDGSPPPA